MNDVEYMLVVIIHELGDVKCVVVGKLLCFYDFCENGSTMEKFDFDELERIDNVVVLS